MYKFLLNTLPNKKRHPIIEGFLIGLINFIFCLHSTFYVKFMFAIFVFYDRSARIVQTLKHNRYKLLCSSVKITVNVCEQNI